MSNHNYHYNIDTMVDVKELRYLDKKLLYMSRHKYSLLKAKAGLDTLDASYENDRCPGCDRMIPPIVHHWYDSSGLLHWVAICRGCNLRLGKLFKSGYPDSWEEQLSPLRERVAWTG